MPNCADIVGSIVEITSKIKGAKNGVRSGDRKRERDPLGIGISPLVRNFGYSRRDFKGVSSSNEGLLCTTGVTPLEGCLSRSY